MDTTTAERIARRFVTLPLDQRQQILEKLQSSGQSFRLLPIVAAREGSVPVRLSYAQQRLLFLWQLEPQSAAYNVPTAVRLRGELNEAALRQAFGELIARHETLRTHFISEEGVFYQVISETLELPLQVIDLQDDEADLQARIDDEFSRPFDLLSGPLLRIGLWRIRADEHVLTLCQHHIISDGWSAQLLINEFAQAYGAALQGRPTGFAALPIQYADYALWQRAWLEAGEGARQLTYWKEQLGSEQPLIALPTDHPRPAQPSFRGGRVEADLDTALADALKQLTRQGGYTLFMLMLAALGVTLSRFSGQDDIRIGTPNAGRNRKELEGLAGFFINTQVLRLNIDERQSFTQLLEQVRQLISGAQSHQDLPFEQLVEALAPERTLSHNPLFQVKLNQNLAGDTATQGVSQRLQGLEVSGVAVGADEARFDLALDFSETATGIHGYFTYALDLFEASTVQRLADAFKGVLRAMIDAHERPLLTRPVIAAAEAPVNLQHFPCSDMLALWRNGLVMGAGGVALRCADKQLSYADLEAESNRLAHYLGEQGVLPGAVVGLCMERCIEWVVSWLAILKAGATCLPLDPTQPSQRLSQLAHDSVAQRVICGAASAASLFANALAYDSGRWLHCASDAPPLSIVPDQPAYVIYTSGSTGQPKGVVISHGALADYVQGIQQHLASAPGGSMALVSTPAADLGHTQLFGALASGVTLHLLPQEYAFDPDRFAAYMNEHQVAVLKLVPSHLQGLLQAARPAEVLPAQLLILGGERCDWALVEQIRRLKPACRVLNHYGPTETTVGVLAHPLENVDKGYDSVPLGTPLANARVAVLDAWLVPVAERVAGELYLGGPGVAQGYLGQPGLTAERFIPAPDGGRWYRSGDRVRLDRQRVVFLGRTDDQVKIRGYRVELGEVAQALRGLDGVQEAVVQALPMDNDAERLQLLAWCVADSGRSAETLKAGLQASLPEAMVPSQILLLERLPLTANGKLDKRALPMPDAAQGEYVAPSGEIEQTLARVWADVLKLERVGAHDNFFELGGDSILSLQIIARAKRQGVKITPKQLFERQTVARLAQVAKPIQAKVAPGNPAGDADHQGRVPLVPAQARFFDSPVVARQHWNQSILLTPRETLDEQALADALEAVVAQHDALRLSFRLDAGQWLAEFVPTAASGLLWRRKLDSFEELEAHADEAQRSLNLEGAQLMRAVLFEDARGTQRLLLIVHHLVVDGVSWRVLLEDLQNAYQQRRAGQPVQLPGKTTAFKHWAERLQAFAADPQLLAEQDYWLNALDDGLAGLLATASDATQGTIPGQITTRLDATQTQRLLKLAPIAYRTQVNDLLLAALALAVQRWSGEASVSVMLEGHGREDVFEGVDLSRTLGWFTSLFPVRLSAGDSLAETIKGTKEQLRGVPRRGAGYGVLRYLAAEHICAGLRARPQPRLVFNYLGQFDGSFDEQDGSLFTPAAQGTGTARCPQTAAAQVVSIDGQVYGGELSLIWSFSSQVFAPSEVQALAQHYRQALLEVIEQCAGGSNIAITPSDVPLAGLSQAQLDQLPVPAAAIEDVYPLSPMQHGMLFHTLLGQDRHAYVNQLRMTVSGLDVERLRDAWQAVVDAHDVLRSSVVALEPHALQIIRKHLTVPLFVLDWREPAGSRLTLEQWAEADRQQGFDLAGGPLMRLTLIRTGVDTWQMIYTSHHLLMDGWSSTRLQAEVLQRYAGQAVGAPVARYRDYIEWLGQQDGQADQAFWTAQLAPLEQPTRLAVLNAAVQAGAYGEHHQLFDRQQTATLEQFARQERVTVNTLVQSAWLLLLQALTGDACVAFGATVAGRPMALPGIEEQLGLFINTLPVVAEPRPQLSVGDWVRSVQDLNLSLREHEHSPLFEIQRWAGHTGEALFDTLLVFENYPVAEALAQGTPGGLAFSQVQSSEQTNYPLTLVMGLGETLAISYAFDQRYFDAARIARIADCFAQLLAGMTRSATQRLGELPLLNEVQARAMLMDWNRTAAPYPSRQCIHALIEAQAAKTPQATA
ncbi:amino acid adenylation domain-containing protein/non-ribosomal peptide synthase protein (TIGR01720 family), partial [Pseudomonas sp. JUb42]